MTACHTAVSAHAPAQTPADARHADADSVRLVTRGIPNFWRAYDLAAGKDSAARVRIFEEVYLRPGTPGLRDWVRVRLMDWGTVRPRLVAAGWTSATVDSARRRERGTPLRDSLERAVAPLAEHSAAEELVAAMARYPRYYAAVRANTLAVDTATVVTGTIRRGLARLHALAPDARFPDVYFVIGKLTTGGTVAGSGVLIGTEQLTSDAATPLDEVPALFRPILAANRPERLAGLVLHEAAHTMQRERSSPTLLEQALVEGGADFVSELAAGPWHADTPHMRYGPAHERLVWLDFRRDIAGGDSTIHTGMYNGMVPAPRNHGATDVGGRAGGAPRDARVRRPGARAAGERVCGVRGGATVSAAPDVRLTRAPTRRMPAWRRTGRAGAPCSKRPLAGTRTQSQIARSSIAILPSPADSHARHFRPLRRPRYHALHRRGRGTDWPRRPAPRRDRTARRHGERSFEQDGRGRGPREPQVGRAGYGRRAGRDCEGRARPRHDTRG